MLFSGHTRSPYLSCNCKTEGQFHSVWTVWANQHGAMWRVQCPECRKPAFIREVKRNGYKTEVSYDMSDRNWFTYHGN